MSASPKPDTPIDFFDAAANEYGPQYYGVQAHSFMRTRHAQVLRLLEEIPRSKSDRALDAGCGPGYLVRDLARRGWQVAATDAAIGMVREAKVTAADASAADRITYSCSDIERLPFAEGAFDLVCSTGVIEYLTEDRQALSEFHRILRPGGHLVLSVTNARSPSLVVDSLVEALKRSDWIRRPFNAAWTRIGRPPVRPRKFRVRRHLPSQFRRSLGRAGFVLVDDAFFHYLPWPRPLDKLAPAATASLGRRMERYLPRTWLRGIGEGYVTVSRKG